MKLSNNFELNEFCYSASTGITITPTEIQMQLLKMICINTLQPLRDWYNQPIIITSGIRNKEITTELRRKGFQVSLLSDHFYAQEPNPYATGAVDFIVKEKKDLSHIYYWIKKNIPIEFIRQVIIYLPNKHSGFIHISNSMDVFWEVIKEYNQKYAYLMNKHGRFMLEDKEQIRKAFNH